MQSLRRARLLARLVLVWFALAVGAAVASPLVRPQSVELICSGGGAMKLLVKGDDGNAAPASHTLDCPLCGSFDAPASASGTSFSVPPAAAPLAIAQVLPALRPVAVAPPARGPPSPTIG
jgi:hypothetical protein